MMVFSQVLSGQLNLNKHLITRFLLCQLVCFMMAVAFSAGGGENPDKAAGGYNSFFYFKAVFLVLPIACAGLWSFVSATGIWRAFLDVLKHNLLLLVYFGFAILSLVLAYDRMFSLQRLIYTSIAMTSLFMLMAQYVYLLGEEVRATIYRHMLAIFTLGIGVPILCAVFFGPMLVVTNIRAAIQALGLIHPNTLAAFYAYGFLHALFYTSGGRTQRYEFRQGEKPIRAFLIVMMPLLFFMIFSRSVIVSVTASMLVAFWFGFIWFRFYPGIVLIGLITAAAIFLQLFIHLDIIPLDLIVSSVSRVEGGEDLITLTHRTDLWEAVLNRMDWKVFLIGNGYGVMTPGYGIDFGTGILYGAHNTYLSIFLCTGIFSLFAFLGYLLSIFMRLRSVRSLFGMGTTMQFTAMIAFFMVHSITSTEFSLNLGVNFTIVILMNTLALNPRYSRAGETS